LALPRRPGRTYALPPGPLRVPGRRAALERAADVPPPRPAIRPAEPSRDARGLQPARRALLPAERPRRLCAGPAVRRLPVRGGDGRRRLRPRAGAARAALRWSAGRLRGPLRPAGLLGPRPRPCSGIDLGRPGGWRGPVHAGESRAALRVRDRRAPARVP